METRDLLMEEKRLCRDIEKREKERTRLGRRLFKLEKKIAKEKERAKDERIASVPLEPGAASTSCGEELDFRACHDEMCLKMFLMDKTYAYVTLSKGKKNVLREIELVHKQTDRAKRKLRRLCKEMLRFPAIDLKKTEELYVDLIKVTNDLSNAQLDIEKQNWTRKRELDSQRRVNETINEDIHAQKVATQWKRGKRAGLETKIAVETQRIERLEGVRLRLLRESWLQNETRTMKMVFGFLPPHDLDGSVDPKNFESALRLLGSVAGVEIGAFERPEKHDINSFVNIGRRCLLRGS
eukprot:g1554.t1